METDRIAAIARSLPPIPSCRTALRLLAGLGLLGTGGVLARAEVEAKKKRGKSKGKKGKGKKRKKDENGGN